MSLSSLQHCFIVAVTGSVLFVSGCAKPAREAAAPVEKTKPQVELIKHSVEKSSSHELVGVWLGKGALDQGSLTLAIKGLSPITQRQVNAAADAFLATGIAVEFKSDQTMETAIVALNQRGARDSGVELASWEASRTVNRGEYRVASVEVQADGSKITDYKTYRISADRQTLTLLVDLPGLLGQCNPRIVFQRQPDEAASVATGSENTLLR